MKRVICLVCGNSCSKYGRNKSGSQRWICRNCKSINTPKIDNLTKQLNIFLKWLFSKDIQKDMPGCGLLLGEKHPSFGIYGHCRQS